VFGLIDEAFETGRQTDGTVAVAMNVNVTYISSPEPGARLRAEARCVAQTKRTATYDIKVADADGACLQSARRWPIAPESPSPSLNPAGNYQ